MYCTNCGQHVADNAKFCWHCGERITQHNLTTTPEAIDDLVTNKAEEIMVQEDNISFSDLGTNDYVAKKASFIGSVNDPETTNPSIVSNCENRPRYKETRDTITNYLLRIKKEDTTTHSVSYCILNTNTNNQSEWFDYINYCGCGIFYIQRNGLGGLMEVSFANYQLWNQISNDQGLFYCVEKNNKWAIITIQHKKIEQLTAYEYDYSYPFIEGAAIVKQNDKYGYFIYDEDANITRIIPCILDDAQEFITNSITCDASIIYQGQSYKMDKKGDLYIIQKKRDQINWLFFGITGLFKLSLLIFGIILYKIPLEGMSYQEASHAPICTTDIIILLIGTAWTIISSIKYLKKDDVYVFQKNIAKPLHSNK